MNHLPVLITTALLLAGCAASPVNLTTNDETNSIVTINSNCKSECKSAISTHLNKETGFFKGTISGLILVSVDERFGDNKYYDPRGSYNSTWNGSFSVRLSSGKHKFLVKPDYYKANPNDEVLLEVELKGSQEYFLGSFLEFNEYHYEWMPVIFNNSTGKVSYVKNWRQGYTQPSIPVIIPVY